MDPKDNVIMRLTCTTIRIHELSAQMTCNWIIWVLCTAKTLISFGKLAKCSKKFYAICGCTDAYAQIEE